MFKLKTIDVWDTLLRRKNHPDFSKLASARLLSLEYSSRIRKEFVDHLDIYRERCRIEGEMARDPSSLDGEYEIHEVLKRTIANTFEKEDMDYTILATRLAEIEFKFEMDNTYPDPHFNEFNKIYPAEKTLFLSDFYMPSSWLIRLLEHHNLGEIVKEGISSSDIKCNKRSGKAFLHLHEKLGINPQEHIHIGDNLHADVEVPSKLGIKAIHFQPEQEHRNRQEREPFFLNRTGLFNHISESISKSAAAEMDKLPMEARSAFLQGIESSPLFVGFMLHIAEVSLAEKIQKLYFFTREGEFFIQVWRRLFPEKRFIHQKLPAEDVLQVSRVSTFCASLQEVSTDEMMRLWNQYSVQSIYAMLKSLGLDPNDFLQLCTEHGIEIDQEIIYPWQDKRVQDLFHDTKFTSLVEKKVCEERGKLKQYLTELSWDLNLERVGIVDIGWRGTIQDNLGLIASHTSVFGFYMGLQKFLNKQPSNCSKSAFGPDANVSQENINLLDSVSIIEMLSNSPNGSVTAYRSDENGHIVADRIIDERENTVFYSYTTHFQNGVLYAVKHYAEYINNHVISSFEIKDKACKIWQNLVTNPSDELSKAHTALKHNEVFGVGKFVDKSQAPSAVDILLAIFNKTKRIEIISFIRKEQSAKSIWNRESLSIIQKIFFYIFIKYKVYVITLKDKFQKKYT